MEHFHPLQIKTKTKQLALLRIFPVILSRWLLLLCGLAIIYDIIWEVSQIFVSQQLAEQ